MRNRAAQKAINAGSRNAVGSRRERTLWGALLLVLGKIIAIAMINSPSVTKPRTRVAHGKPSLGWSLENMMG
jgi:hypothetical protein